MANSDESSICPTDPDRGEQRRRDFYHTCNKAFLDGLDTEGRRLMEAGEIADETACMAWVLIAMLSEKTGIFRRRHR